MSINWNFKTELGDRYGSQVQAANALGLLENRLSYIIRGHSKPSKQEREALEEALGKALVAPAGEAARACGSGEQVAKIKMPPRGPRTKLYWNPHQQRYKMRRAPRRFTPEQRLARDERKRSRWITWLRNWDFAHRAEVLRKILAD